MQLEVAWAVVVRVVGVARGAILGSVMHMTIAYQLTVTMTRTVGGYLQMPLNPCGDASSDIAVVH